MQEFLFSIHIPGWLILKELYYPKEIWSFTFPSRHVGILFTCLFETTEVNCHYWNKVILHFFSGLKQTVFCSLFIFVLLNFSTCWKYPLICNNIEKLPNGGKKKPPRIEYYNYWNINTRNVDDEEMHPFILISTLKLVQKERGEIPP